MKSLKKLKEWITNNMFHLFVATPEKVYYDGQVTSVSVPGTSGYFEVLSDHAPIISALVFGKISLKEKDGKTTLWKVSGGFIEMLENNATILADSLELLTSDPK